MDLFFSICIPNYNYSKYIEETINSVLDQDFENYEIIVVDNDSTDESWEIIKRYSDHKKVKIFKNNFNIGFAPNLQKVTEKARGKFINLLSADDKMQPGTLTYYYSELVKLEKETNIDNLFLFSDVEIIDENSNPQKIVSSDRKTFSNVIIETEKYNPIHSFFETSGYDILKRCLPLLKNPAPFVSTIVSRNLWQKVEGFNAVRTIGPDKFYNYKILSLNPRVLYTKYPLFQYRVHSSENFLAQVSNANQQIDDYLNVLYFSEIAKSLNVDRTKMVNSYIYRVCFMVGIKSIFNFNYFQSWRVFGAMLFFPKHSLISVWFYLLFLIIITYPFSGLAINIVKKLKDYVS